MLDLHGKLKLFAGQTLLFDVLLEDLQPDVLSTSPAKSGAVSLRAAQPNQLLDTIDCHFIGPKTAHMSDISRTICNAKEADSFYALSLRPSWQSGSPLTSVIDGQVGGGGTLQVVCRGPGAWSLQLQIFRCLPQTVQAANK